ncbi:carboxypeptidase-like regulatory domain-containing protein [Flavobacteriaceae bacterium TK19130]|nr:carboxypeptidase-like regulatory domain-containing protein [Thermobacterium salinum]
MKRVLTYMYLTCLTLAILSCSEDKIESVGSGTLTGIVYDAVTNEPLADVQISTQPLSSSVLTRGDGTFKIDDINEGEYAVQASLAEYTTTFESAIVEDNETTNVIFELDKSIANNEAPTIQLLSPADNATDVPLTTDFVWTATDEDNDPLSYTLELRNAATNETTLFEEIQDTTVTVENLQQSTTYFWQVTVDDNINPSVLSNISSFTTVPINSNRFFYVRNEEGNNVIYSGDEPDGDETNQNELRLTASSENSFRPRANSTAGKIAFIRSVGAAYQLFTMNYDGTAIDQITNAIPIAGFRQDELDFTWYDDGARLYYPNFNKLYSVNRDGTGTELIYEAPSGTFITEVDANETNSLIAVKTNNANGYEARIFILDPDTGMEVDVIVENVNGALGGLDYSIDGSQLLFTQDVSGFENGTYRQLDTKLFIYDFDSDTSTEIDTDKPAGTNDLDPRFAPDEGSVIYVNTSNDNVSQRNIYRTVLDDDADNRQLLFTNAFMPDWE